MFSTLSSIPAVNTYVFAAIVAAATYIAFVAGRAAYHNVGRSLWKRSLRWAISGMVSVIVLAALTMGRWVPGDQIGVGTEKVYSPGWHVYPREAFVTLPRAGMFTIPYPDDRRFLEVSYLITDSERLRYFCEEIRTFTTPVAEGIVVFGTSTRDAFGRPVSIFQMNTRRVLRSTYSCRTSPPTEFRLMRDYWFSSGVEKDRKSGNGVPSSFFPRFLVSAVPSLFN